MVKIEIHFANGEDAHQITLSRLLLEKPSHLDLHCLQRPICPKTYYHYNNVKLLADNMILVRRKAVFRVSDQHHAN